MRDLIVTLIVVGSLPFILLRAHIGILMWSWISFMNPHRLSWGYAYNMPFGAVVAATTLVSFFLNPSQRRAIPVNAITVTLVIWILWINVTTIRALDPTEAWGLWDKVMKIQLMIFVMLMLSHGKQRILAVIWVTTLSVAFFGIKGGVFTIQTGGNFTVWGPPGSYFYDNNALALALIMVMPLLIFLRSTVEKTWIRHLLLLFVLLCALSSLGSFSRGAFLAGGAVIGFLWLKSRRKTVTLIAIAIVLPVMIVFMPDKWTEEMKTITEYEADASAQGRINAWMYAFNLANDKPFGGGLGVFQPEYFVRWAPNPEDFHDAHSIYFEILAEQGWVGLALFLTLLWLTWRHASRIIKDTRHREDLEWANNLARMIQVSFVGYMSGGAFLGLGYWDLPFYLMAIIALVRREVSEALAQTAADQPRDPLTLGRHASARSG
jgi:probable O-glycosylation ligase (exosortase A-associated)